MAQDSHNPASLVQRAPMRISEAILDATGARKSGTFATHTIQTNSLDVLTLRTERGKGIATIFQRARYRPRERPFFGFPSLGPRCLPARTRTATGSYFSSSALGIPILPSNVTAAIRFSRTAKYTAPREIPRSLAASATVTKSIAGNFRWPDP